MRKFRLFSIAALALAMAACSSEENTLETQSPAAPGKLHFTATIATPDNGAGTRTEYTEITSGDDAGKINVKWAVDDQIALVHNGVVDIAKVTAVDGSGKATIEADITGSPSDNDDVYLAYPADAVADATPSSPLPFTPNSTTFDKVKSQDGTLEFIQNNLDLRMGSGKLAVSGDKATLKESVSIPSLICIWKLTLQDNAATPNALNATKLTFINNTDIQAAAATSTGKSEYYLCVVPSFIPDASGTFSFEATVGSDTYTFSKTGLSLTAGKYYQSTLKMAKASVPANTPDIAQADCTFSPSNGKSTLSNTNITTSMEYSTDGGTTWTDVTTAGSIASLEAGTVQIRVKETDDYLASEAVSITVPQVLKINELVGPYTGDKLTCEYYAGETWQALVDRYALIKVYSGRAAFGSDGFIYESGSFVQVTALVDNTKTYDVQ